MNRSPRSAHGFSLFELLAVVSILVLLASFSVPAISSMTGTKNATACSKLMAFLALSRGQAIASQNPAWIVCHESNGEMRLSLVTAPSGEIPPDLSWSSPSTGSIDAASAGLAEIGTPLKLQSVTLGSELPADLIADPAMQESEIISSENTQKTIRLHVGGKTLECRVLLMISPSGEVRSPATDFGYARFIPTEQKGACNTVLGVVQLNLCTGQNRLFRP